jgi:hypothetical protein
LWLFSFLSCHSKVIRGGSPNDLDHRVLVRHLVGPQKLFGIAPPRNPFDPSEGTYRVTVGFTRNTSRSPVAWSASRWEITTESSFGSSTPSAFALDSKMVAFFPASKKSLSRGAPQAPKNSNPSLTPSIPQTHQKNRALVLRPAGNRRRLHQRHG